MLLGIAAVYSGSPAPLSPKGPAERSFAPNRRVAGPNESNGKTIVELLAAFVASDFLPGIGKSSAGMKD